MDILRSEFEECRSSLLSNQGWGLKNLILSLIGTEVSQIVISFGHFLSKLVFIQVVIFQLAVSRSDLMKFVAASLAYIQRGKVVSCPNFDEFLDSLLLCLIAQGLILPKKNSLEPDSSANLNQFAVTPLGVATFKGNLIIPKNETTLRC